MTSTQTGLMAGLILGAVAALGGFPAFLITLFVGVLGLIAGRVLDGELDISGILGRGRDK
jgi:ribose/xylose/arabinose/galactoside ABC-type transport system permease subunit